MLKQSVCDSAFDTLLCCAWRTPQVMWSVTQLPADALELHAVPRPLGGVLVFGANCVLRLNQVCSDCRVCVCVCLVPLHVHLGMCHESKSTSSIFPTRVSVEAFIYVEVFSSSTEALSHATHSLAKTTRTPATDSVFTIVHMQHQLARQRLRMACRSTRTRATGQHPFRCVCSPTVRPSRSTAR